MFRVLRSFVFAGVLVSFLVSAARGVLLSAQVVAVNDQAITPTDQVTIAPGDSVTIDFFVSGWDENLPGSALRFYQIGIDGLTTYSSGSAGRLIPRGWDALRPPLCSLPNECPQETPFCNIPSGTCTCINLQGTCPMDFETCFRGLCVGSNHDLRQATYIDVERNDYAYSGLYPIAAIRQPLNDLKTLLGGTPLAPGGPLDVGQTLYAGTHVLHASTDVCGPFTFSFELDGEATFFGLEVPPITGVDLMRVTPSVQTVTIDVDTGTTCPARMMDSTPSAGSTLPKAGGNAVTLRFNQVVSAPSAQQISIVELTPEVCGGSPGINLSGLFEFRIDFSDQSRLTILEQSGATLRHGVWYRISKTEEWNTVQPFEVDFLALRGDANGDGFVNFTDLSAIHRQIPKIKGAAEIGSRYDINADGFVNFSDLSAAFQFIPTFKVPHPCP